MKKENLGIYVLIFSLIFGVANVSLDGSTWISGMAILGILTGFTLMLKHIK